MARKWKLSDLGERGPEKKKTSPWQAAWQRGKNRAVGIQNLGFKSHRHHQQLQSHSLSLPICKMRPVLSTSQELVKVKVKGSF